MANEPDHIIPVPTTWKEKLLFHVTAFFLLVCIFSAFGFLFLVPFIIEPAYTTIRMDFDEEPAQCVTASTHIQRGLSNCSWTSCREGCTREVYECTQIFVNYRHPNLPNLFVLDNTNVVDGGGDSDEEPLQMAENRIASAVDYEDEGIFVLENTYTPDHETNNKKYKWFYGARLFPNVKGCGYPPYLNCTLFNDTYVRLGSNFTCYYSRSDPSLVVSELDMERVHMHLIYALVMPVVSFVLSTIYLTLAYFYIYSEPKVSGKGTPRQNKACASGLERATAAASVSNFMLATPLALSTPIAPPATAVLSPVSDMYQDDLTSFGDEYNNMMVDDMLSRDSLDSSAFNYSSSMNENLNKMMTTCILTPPGPIAEL